MHLGTETVEGTTRAFEGIDDVEGSNRLALGMFGVGDRVTNDLCKSLGLRQRK